MPGKRGCHLLEGDRLATERHTVGGKACGSLQAELKLAVRPYWRPEQCQGSGVKCWAKLSRRIS